MYGTEGTVGACAAVLGYPPLGSEGACWFFPFPLLLLFTSPHKYIYYCVGRGIKSSAGEDIRVFHAGGPSEMFRR